MSSKSFAIKSSHRLTKTAPEEALDCVVVDGVQTPRVTCEPTRPEGSQQGITVKTTVTACEDFY